MTREDLERAVERAVAFMSPAEVRVVIDLVVEACCEKLTVLRGRVLKDGFAAFAVGVQEARRDLMQTFLPTTEPTDGK